MFDSDQPDTTTFTFTFGSGPNERVPIVFGAICGYKHTIPLVLIAK